jgi:hypothetical protein
MNDLTSSAVEKRLLQRLNLLLVIPAKAGIQPFSKVGEELDPSLRWNDEHEGIGP